MAWTQAGVSAEVREVRSEAHVLQYETKRRKEHRLFSLKQREAPLSRLKATELNRGAMRSPRPRSSLSKEAFLRHYSCYFSEKKKKI